MKLLRLGLLVLAGIFWMIAAHAAPIEAYGRLPTLEEVQLSPDGNRIAYVTAVNEQRTITIHDLSGKEKPVLIPGGNQKLRQLQWAGDGHLVITASQTSVMPIGLQGPMQEFFMVTVCDIARRRCTLLEPGLQLRGSDQSMNVVSAEPMVRMVDGHPLVFFEPIVFVNNAGERALFSYNPESGQIREVVPPRTGARSFAVDPNGRAMAESLYVRGQWLLWLKRSVGWETALSMEAPVDIPVLQGLGRTPDTVLLSMPLKEQAGVFERRELLLNDGTWATDLPERQRHVPSLRDPVTGLAIGYIETALDRITYTFYEPALQTLWVATQKAFPGEQVEYVSMSSDHKKIVVKVFGPTTGAAYMLVDRNTGHADWLGDIYKELLPEDIAAVRSIVYPASDGLRIPAYLTLPKGREAKNLPLVVLPHGGPAARDKLDFDWWAQALASRGYAVLQPQFRGSSGFSPAFMTAGFGQWGRKMQSDLSDGVRYLAALGVIDPKRVCITGGSYGGYAALAGVTIENGVYRCAVAVAGVADLGEMLDSVSERSRYQSSLLYWQRFMGVENERDPALAALSPVIQAAKASAPILLIHGEDDTVVPYQQSWLMARALKKADKPFEFVTLKGEDHWLSRSETRLQMLQETIRFLEIHNPVGASMQTAAVRP